MAETLKEYLVKLGWDINKSQLTQSLHSINSFSSSSEGLISRLSKNLLKAGSAVASALLGTTSAVTAMMFGVADADREVERFARRMWMTESQARSLTTALDAVGASYQDIYYMTAEEYRNLLELNALGRSLEAPAELQDQLRQVRDINQEIDKLKVTISYGTQWVAYYFLKIMGEDVDNLQDSLEKLNEYLQKNLPKIAEKVATVLSWFFRLGKTAVDAIGRIVDAVGRLFDSMDTGTKTAVTAVSAFLGLLKLGPVGMFIAAILALLLLLDDFFTWQRGGNAYFAPEYEKLTNWFQNADFSAFDGVKESAGELWETAKNAFEVVVDLVEQFGEWAAESGVLKGALDLLLGTLELIIDALTWVLDLFLLITGNYDKMSENSWFRKIIAKDEEGNVSGWKTAANAGMGILDAIPGLWNYTIGRIEGMPKAQTFSDFFGYDYGTGKSTENAFGATSGGGRRTSTTEQNVTTTYNNTFNVDGAQSPASTASEIAKTLYNQRSQIDLVK